MYNGLYLGEVAWAKLEVDIHGCTDVEFVVRNR